MIRVLELFAGIGACSKAITRLGIEHEIVDAVEIDKYAIRSFNAIHGTKFEPQDITQWNKDLEVDLIMHGSPCQDFSVAGLNKGGDKGSGTRSSLMYETLRIVEKVKPKYVIWENVKNLLSKKHRHNFDAYIEAMDKLGYHSNYQVLNAKDFGVPQNRERVFTVSIRNDLNVNFKFPEPQELTIRLKDVLEPQVDEKYYLSDEQTKRLKMTTYNAGSEKARVQDTDREAITLCARDYKDPKCVREPIIIDDYNQRVRADQDTMGTLTTNCGASAPRNGFKIAEPQASLEQPIYRDYEDPKCVRVGGLYDKDGSRHQAGSIYDPNGVCATLSTMQGGNQEPIIVASRGRNPESPSDRLAGQKLEQRLEPNRQGITNTITSVQKDNYVAEPTPLQRRVCNEAIAKGLVEPNDAIEYTYSSARLKEIGGGFIKKQNMKDNNVMSTLKCNPQQIGICVDSPSRVAIRTANKQGYDIATDGDGVDLSYPQSKTKRGRVGHGVSKTLMGADSMGTVDNYRIRKLTPKECWRLMGFDDSDFEKAEKVNSNTQLYKQAGNSIVVNVLEGILKNLLEEE